MTPLRAAVRAGARRLREAGVPSADVDAVLLAAHLLGLDPPDVHRLMALGGDLPALFEERYAAHLAERARRVPLQHLTGRAAFRRLSLRVGPGVFVPRPETEMLVELALAEIDRRHPATHLPNESLEGELSGIPARSATNGAFEREGEGGTRVVDLCTGSGAIALAIKDERPHVTVRGVELSEQAFAWATANRADLGLDVELHRSDATAPCLPDWAGTVDVVTVNPPYIPTGATPVDPEVRDHDPALALYGGSEDGLAVPLAVAGTAATLLRPGGLLLMEHAESQGDSLPARLRATGPWSDVLDHDDLAGRPRVATARRRGD